MGTKRKRQKNASHQDVLQRARRELQKGNAKAALKDARVCFRADPTADARQFLEEALLGRVEQLYNQRFLDEARSALKELVELKPSSPDIQARVARFQLALGSPVAQTGETAEQDPAVLIELADEAVLDSRCRVPHPQHQQEADQIRQALLHVEQARDEEAARLLSEIPRKSPLGDWKLFVRGLSAFYQGDLDRAEENWRRLDASRPAWRIAQTLRVASGQRNGDEMPIDLTSRVRRLEKSFLADPCQEPLQGLAQYWKEQRWSKFLHEYRNFRQRFGNSHADLVSAILDLVWKRAVRDEDSDLLNNLARLGPGPPLDPHWNRARALLAEEVGHYEVSAVVDNWQRYARDVAELACLREDERSIAAGLVHLHLAREYRRWAEDNSGFDDEDPDDSLEFDTSDEYVKRFLTSAAHEFRRAIELCPKLTAAYRELAELNEQLDQRQRSAILLERLLHIEPHDVDAHVWLANYYLEQEDPEKCEPHVQAVQRLKPRHSGLNLLHWNQRLVKIRGHVKKKQFDEARRELDPLAAHPFTALDPYLVHALRAAIELKAKNEPAGRQALEEALSTVDQPAPVWLQLSHLAARLGLPRTKKKEFDDGFKRELNAKLTGATFGRIARLLSMFKESQIKYVGLPTQQRLFRRCLERLKQMDGSERDTIDVLCYCKTLDRTPHIALPLAKQAAKRFPDSVQAQFLAGQLEMDRGPWHCNHDDAKRALERALELAQQSRDPEDKLLIEEARRAIALLEEHMQGYRWFAPFF